MKTLAGICMGLMLALLLVLTLYEPAALAFGWLLDQVGLWPVYALIGINVAIATFTIFTMEQP